MAESILTWLFIKIADTAVGKLIANALEKQFPNLFKSKTKDIVRLYERRIEQNNKEIRSLERSRDKQQKKFSAEKNRMVGSLKRRSIATEKLIGQYHKPLNAILISYSSQYEDANGHTRKTHFIKDELARFNSKYLGGSDALIPPAAVPKSLKTQQDLRKWFEKEILKGRYCKIKFLVMFDLKKSAFWGVYLPYVQKNPMNYTIGEVLKVEDVFTGKEIDRLAISEIIDSGDIAWLASTILSEKELEIILKNQKNIERSLGNPSLRILSDESIAPRLKKVLSKYLKKTDEVTKAIIDEAKFWKEKLNEQKL